MIMTTEITNSYLMWIGKEHYPKISDWSAEALSVGISKRLPNDKIAEKLMEPGSVIFVAHDEGEYSECPECFGEIECPEARKLRTEIERLEDDIDDLQKQKKESLYRYADGIIDAAEREAQQVHIAKLLKNRETRLEKLNGHVDAMPKTIEAGTGGTVQVEGETWDYRKYNYWLHQPKKWNEDDHSIKKDQCETCGGTGRLPEGKVFGLFLPSAIEYILKADDNDTIKAEIEARKITTVSTVEVAAEAKRGCGKRKAGGYYVVTRTEDNDADAKAIVEKLVAEGKIDPEAVEINGNFVRFLAPVDIDCKRFRGIKRWSMDVDAAEEAEAILEAMA